MVPPSIRVLALVALALPAGCVATPEREGVGEYCHRDDQCLEGLQCIELTCRERTHAVADGGPGRDAGPADAGPVDAGAPPDSGPGDAGPPDAGPPDAGPPDGGPADAGPPDAGPADAGIDAFP